MRDEQHSQCYIPASDTWYKSEENGLTFCSDIHNYFKLWPRPRYFTNINNFYSDKYVFFPISCIKTQ